MNKIKVIREAVGEREGKRITQAEFANRIGCGATRNQVANYELGRVTPPEWFYQRMKHVFKVRSNWLETGEGEIFEPLTTEEALENALFCIFDDLAECRFLARMIAALTVEELTLLLDFVSENCCQ